MVFGCCRAPFIHQANYAMVMFEQRDGGRPYTQLHLTASTLAAALNNANYSALLGFAQGNLAEMSSFARAERRPPPQPEQRTTFTDSFCFEPPAGDRPSFYMTVSVPDLTVCLTLLFIRALVFFVVLYKYKHEQDLTMLMMLISVVS